MRSNLSGLPQEPTSPEEDNARWEAYRALMRKRGDIQILPGLEDDEVDDPWRPGGEDFTDADEPDEAEAVASPPPPVEMEPVSAAPAPAAPTSVEAANLRYKPARTPRAATNIGLGGMVLATGAAALIAGIAITGPMVPEGRHAPRPVVGAARENANPPGPQAQLALAVTPPTNASEAPIVWPLGSAERASSRKAPLSTTPTLGMPAPSIAQTAAAQTAAPHREHAARIRMASLSVSRPVHHAVRRKHAASRPPAAVHEKTWTAPYQWSDQRWSW